MFRATDVHWMGVHSSFTLIHGKHERARKKIIHRLNATAVWNGNFRARRDSPRLILRAASSCVRPLNYSHYERVSLHILAHPSTKLPSAWRFMQNASPWFPIKAAQALSPSGKPLEARRRLTSSVLIGRAKDAAIRGKRSQTGNDEISSLDRDITLESLTNVAFPWNRSFPGPETISSQARYRYRWNI